MRTKKTIRPIIILLGCCWLSACAATPASQPLPAAPQVQTEPAIDLQEFESRMQRLQDSVVMLEARLLDQQRVIESFKVALQSGSLPHTAAGSSTQTATAQKSPNEIYQAAFGSYAAGQYQASIDGFSRFLQLFPANDYASNARYWLAECFLAVGQYQKAIADFEKVFTDYPKSTKAPDALLKKAAALYQLDMEEQAIETIELLKERYPKSNAARNAADTFN